MDPVNQDQPNNLSEGYEERKYNRKDGSFDLYHGSIINNMRHGKGTMIYSNGDIYEGQWNNNQREGDGKLIFKGNDNDVYEGKFFRDKMHGIGKRFYSKGDKFEGYFNSGKRREGTFQFASGDVFVGTFGCVRRDRTIRSETKMMTGTLTYKKDPIIAKFLGPKSTVRSVWIQDGQRNAVYRPVESHLDFNPPPERERFIIPPIAIIPPIKPHPVIPPPPVFINSQTLISGRIPLPIVVAPTSPTSKNDDNISPTSNNDDNKNHKIWVGLVCCIMLVYIISMISSVSPPTPFPPIPPGIDRRPWACNFPFAYMMSEKCMSDATLNPLYGDDLCPLLE